MLELFPRRLRKKRYEAGPRGEGPVRREEREALVLRVLVEVKALAQEYRALTGDAPSASPGKSQSMRQHGCWVLS